MPGVTQCPECGCKNITENIGLGYYRCVECGHKIWRIHGYGRNLG